MSARTILSLALAAALTLPAAGFAGCSSAQQAPSSAAGQQSSQNAAAPQGAGERPSAPDIAGLTYERTMDLKYATQFDVYYYEGGYKLIDVHGSARYLVVPEGAQAPQGLDSDIVVLQAPLDRIYMGASSAMAQFFSIGADADVAFSGTDESGWQIDEPRQALESGAMAYAGKYSAPDYEQLVAGGCDLALESTMILHAPDAQEMLEELGIPVFIERSSYEAEPLGRAEWVRAFGALTDREDEAEAAFEAQEQVVQSIGQEPATGKTVVFFSVSPDGTVAVRRPDDYVARAIEQAGGSYAFDGLKTAEQNPSVSITMEDFYSTASQADYLVYNGTIDDPLSSVDDLLGKSDVFADFKAVKEGHVWTSDRKMFQSTDQIAAMIEDFHTVVTDGDPESTTFLHKVS